MAALKDLRNAEEVLKKSNDSLSRILFTSNLVSELNILQSSGGVSSDVVLSILTKNGLEEDQVKEILTLLN